MASSVPTFQVFLTKGVLSTANFGEILRRRYLFIYFKWDYSQESEEHSKFIELRMCLKPYQHENIMLINAVVLCFFKAHCYNFESLPLIHRDWWFSEETEGALESLKLRVKSFAGSKQLRFLFLILLVASFEWNILEGLKLSLMKNFYFWD